MKTFVIKMDENFDCKFSMAFDVHGWAKTPDCQHPDLNFRHKFCYGDLKNRPNYCPLEELTNGKDKDKGFK